VRPANLIPAEERRAAAGGFGAAPLAYLLVAALLIAVGGVTLLVVTSDQVATHKTELTEARKETASVEAEAGELASYVEFQTTAIQRIGNVTGLANSRFDWERVMREMALILPHDVVLSSFSASVRSDVSGGGESIALRGEIPGPAISMGGCALGQEGVAGFITALKDIDGVTRVGVQTSAKSGAESGSGSVSASGACPSNATQFQIVVAFDAAPVAPPTGGDGEVIEEAAPEEAPAEGSSESEGESPATSTEGG
jgi:hypothetical protein